MPSAAKKPFLQYFRRNPPVESQPAVYVFPPLNPYIDPDPPPQSSPSHQRLHLVAPADAVESSYRPAPVPLHRRAAYWITITYRNAVCTLCGRPRAKTRKRRARLARHFTLRIFHRSKHV